MYYYLSIVSEICKIISIAYCAMWFVRLCMRIEINRMLKLIYEFECANDKAPEVK